MLFAHKKFLVTVQELEEDGTLHTIGASYPVFKGEMLLTDEYGNKFTCTKQRFEEYYIPVQKVKPRKSKHKNFEEEYIKALQSFELGSTEEDKDYINKTKELIKSKPI